MKTPDEIVMDTLRKELKEHLEKCSEKQVNFFHRIFPVGIEALSEEKLKSALDLVQRTIRKNETDPSRLSV